MLLSNRFSFFNKAGNNINPIKRQATFVRIVDDTEFPGNGAIINAYTNFIGQVIYIEIVDSGSNYGPNTYLEIRSIDDDRIVYTIPNNDITFGVNGEILEIVITSSINNNDLPYPSLDYFIDYTLERVSTGLIAVDQLYILENVSYLTGATGATGPIEKNEYTYPRIDRYGPYTIANYSANGTSAKIEIETYSFTGNLKDINQSKIYRVPTSVINDLVIGMTVSGLGVPANTLIYSIDTAKQIVTLTNFVDNMGNVSFTAYFPHNLKKGSKIVIDGGTAFDGVENTLTEVYETEFFFNTSLVISTTPGGGATYQVTPKFRAYLDGDESFFLFNVNYEEQYPTIEKTKIIDFEFTIAPSSDIVPTATVGGTANNVLYQRTISEDLQQTPFALNIGHSSDVEGVFAGILRIVDTTFTGDPNLLFYAVYRAETEAEDERLGQLLENFGRDVDAEQELILRDSEVEEDNVNYILLNQKRKEMLLMGDQIWPYMGSYKGLVNMINWFGYYDVRLKEYFLNINSMDAEFGKYRQVPITFQLKDKKPNFQELTLVPSKHYKKTSMFGLFYDIVKDSGEFDQYGTPITQDAFEFTNEEALIKFFALKKYLKEKFLPLNAQIVDITGEGVYYERYGINNWNNKDERRILELTRAISFDCEERVQIEDLRTYTSRGLLSPALNQGLQNFLNKYDITDIQLVAPGGPYTSFPLVSFPGISTQQATGYVLMNGYTGTYALANPAGTDYVGGEIITLSGGVYDSPLRVVVTGVSGGAVTDVDILEGPQQGSKYRSFPPAFGQSMVFAPTGTQYIVVDRTGFTAAPSDLGFQVQDVILRDLGLGYTTYPEIVFNPNIGGTIADLTLKIYPGTPVGNINNKNFTKRWNDAPSIPVGGVATLSTDFPVSWDEVPYSWFELSGSNDANVKVYIDPLPAGTGEIIAAEIIEPGTGYTQVPTLQIASQEGYGATLQGSLRNSKLNILEYTVTAVSSGAGTNDIFTVTPDIAALGVKSVSTNRLVKASGISDIVLTSSVSPGPGSTITVSLADGGGPVNTTVAIGDKIYVHEGVYVSNGGSGFYNVPGVNINSGHTQSIFTWNTLGRGEFYEMEWKVQLQEPVDPLNQFVYSSGIDYIDALKDHVVILPYTGKYTVEMIVYNTNNNYANLIRKNCVDVFMAESDFSYISKFVNDGLGTWDSLIQFPNTELNIKALNATNSRNLRYDWDHADSSWVNLVFNDTDWDNAEFRWETLDISDMSIVNNYNFPFCNDFQIIDVSAQDNEEGPVVEYRDSTTTPSAINPTIIVQGQRIYPEIEPAYNANQESIYIRRDDTIYQLEVLFADYSNPGYTYIELTSTPPSAFTSSPTTWEVLREIGGTIIISGNQIYDPVTNQNGLKNDMYVKVFQKNSTPIYSRIPINGKDTYSGLPSYIILDGKANYSDLQKKHEIGRIYKIRDNYANNGNLVWDPADLLSTWWIVPANTVDPTVRDHIGKIYIDSTKVTCDPINEIRPGFTTIKLYAYDGGQLKYTQRFRTTHIFLDTSNTGDAYDIWNQPTYVIDIVGIDGGSIDGLNTYLNNLPVTAEVYLEYEYSEFTTRTYYGVDSGNDSLIYFDFNTYPASLQFSNAPATDFDNTAINDHLNWYFDQGIDYGDFSMRITNLGLWQGGVGTIITLEDEENDLMRISSSFSLCQRNFDEDSAERKLGTQIIDWENYQEVIWEETNAITWNTLDYSNSYWCNFIIKDVVQNSAITFNEDDQYAFTGIVGGMTTPQIYGRALYELNNLTSEGLARFNYFPYSDTPGEVTMITGSINTYQYPDGVITSSLGVGDVIWGEPFPPTATVTSFTGGVATLDQNLLKKAYFLGNAVAGSYKITNVSGLLETQLFPGDIITGSLLPSYPASPAIVRSVQSNSGMIKEITLSEPLSGTATSTSFEVEWVLGTINTTVLSNTGTSFMIVAQANTPGIDCLGYLDGDGGLTFETPDGTTMSVSHTFPVGNYYEWRGYGPNKIGSFLKGINELVINYRNIQTYLSEGVSPSGYAGWYPATSLPPEYQYIQASCIENSDEAKAISERLPYERSIGGAYTWEETWCDSKNGKFPVGVQVLFTSDTSKIPGKTEYLWKILEDDKILVETIDPSIMWTFAYPGIFGVELTIKDTNGNTATKLRNSFVEIYEAKKSRV